MSQSLTTKEISKYVKTIDSLRQHKALKKVSYRNMSFCAGALTGYYYNDKLVYVTGMYAAELGYSEEKLYLRDTIPYKLYYRQYFAEWDKYYLKYPNRELDVDETKMTYSDTIHQITFSSPLKIVKSSKNKIVDTKINNDLYKYLTNCIKTMFVELSTEKTSH